MTLDDYNLYETTLHDAVSPRISWTPQGWRIERTYDFDWADLRDLLPTILGYPEREASGTITRRLPLRDVNFPECVATDVRDIVGLAKASSETASPPMTTQGEPVTTTGGMQRNVYERGRMVVEFTRPAYWVRTDTAIYYGDPGNEFKRFTEVSSVLEGDYLNVKSLQNLLTFSATRSAGGGGGVNAAVAAALGPQLNRTLREVPGKIIGGTNIVVKWHDIPYDSLPVDAIYNCLGKINNAEFGDTDDILRTWSKWSLLLIGASWDIIQLSNGAFGWDVTYHFKHKKDLWNYFYNPFATTRGFYQATANSIWYNPSDDADTMPDGQALYDEADFKTLFTGV